MVPVGPSHFGHQPSDVVGVIPHPPFPGNHLGDPLRGPELRPEPVGHGPIQEQGSEALEVSLREPWRTTGGEPNGEGFFSPLLVLIAPAHHGTSVTSDAAGYLVEREPFVEQGQGPSTSIGDQISRAFGAHNGHPPRIAIIALFTQESI